jgi:hypothetical protein
VVIIVIMSIPSVVTAVVSPVIATVIVAIAEREGRVA